MVSRRNLPSGSAVPDANFLLPGPAFLAAWATRTNVPVVRKLRAKPSRAPLSLNTGPPRVDLLVGRGLNSSHSECNHVTAQTQRGGPPTPR